ncbi:nuclear transport factor 2 family protein [Pseudidiomarina sediminum]|uniref:Nuclear transport factor 2 family protein n=1 Tax=Pseudidiomarina sediminum TaxID=431675 RepID=A0A432Z2L6_9GAMM|nr:nuclear transport factor 2 family protein [Pseudidiomarina sediminum]RUO72144.1 nuclear transport factor 2 family protein [Pseudidiomarina sediminum]
MRLFLLTFLFVGSVFASTTAAQTVTQPSANDATAIETTLSAFLYGASVNDPKVHETFWADELTYTSSSGTRFDKATLLQGTANATRIDDADVQAWYSAENIELKAIGDIVLLNFTLVSTNVATKHRDTYLNSGVMVYRDARWQAINWNATREAATSH